MQVAEGEVAEGQGQEAGEEDREAARKEPEAATETGPAEAAAPAGAGAGAGAGTETQEATAQERERTSPVLPATLASHQDHQEHQDHHNTNDENDETNDCHEGKNRDHHHQHHNHNSHSHGHSHSDSDEEGHDEREEGALTPVQKPLSFTPGRSSWHDAPPVMLIPGDDDEEEGEGQEAKEKEKEKEERALESSSSTKEEEKEQQKKEKEEEEKQKSGSAAISRGFDLELDASVQEPLTDIPNLESPRPRTLDEPYPPERPKSSERELEESDEDDEDDEEEEEAMPTDGDPKSACIGDDESAEGWLGSMTSEHDHGSEGLRSRLVTSEEAVPLPPPTASTPEAGAEAAGEGEQMPATATAAAIATAAATATAAASTEGPVSGPPPQQSAPASADTGSPIGRPTELAAVLPGGSQAAVEEVQKVGQMAPPMGNVEEPSAEVGETSEGGEAARDPFAEEVVPTSFTPAGLAPSVAFRFQMFNMAAATELKDAEAIQGPAGPFSTLASSLSAPLANGRRPDVVFVALPEAPCGAEQLLAACTGDPTNSSSSSSAIRPALSCPAPSQGGSTGSTNRATSRSFGEVISAWPEREEQAGAGRGKASSIMQDGVMRLTSDSPPLEAVASESIRRAWFGASGLEWEEGADQGLDVTSKVKNLLDAGRGLLADVAIFGDPAPGRTKVLLLEFVEDEEDATGHRRADCVVLSSATVESANLHRTKVMGLIDGWVGDFIGDLKTVLAFASRRFSQDVNGDIYVPLVDHTVAGIAMPNPKKCFISKTLVDTGAGGLRFMFAAAHFPISGISETLESDDQSEDTLQTSKRALAGVLRKVLRDLGRKSPIDDKTVIFLQGDLNSRTILKGGQAHDILKDVLDDRLLQRAIAYNLPGIPKGRWKEIVPNTDMRELPVTYKFTHAPLAVVPTEATSSSGSEAPGALRLGDVLARSRAGSTGRSSQASGGNETDLATVLAATDGHDPGAYKQLLLDAGDDFRKAWGISFKPNNFRPFRFPASADRLIYFAADSLCDDLHWELPQGGYSVNYKQGGSDHKPVFLEAILTVRHTGESVDEDSPMGHTRSRGGTALCAELSQLLDGQVIKDSTGTGAMTIWGKARAGWNWTPDSDANACEVCGRAFGIFRRRHHCRLCGCCVCGSCSPDSLRRPLPQLGLSDPCRLCTRCSDASPTPS